MHRQIKMIAKEGYVMEDGHDVVEEGGLSFMGSITEKFNEMVVAPIVEAAHGLVSTGEPGVAQEYWDRNAAARDGNLEAFYEQREAPDIQSPGM
ncbi:MAG: hypothetical protein ACLFU1_05045 [Alphaproteobacteria bacterium]